MTWEMSRARVSRRVGPSRKDLAREAQNLANHTGQSWSIVQTRLDDSISTPPKHMERIVLFAAADGLDVQATFSPEVMQ